MASQLPLPTPINAVRLALLLAGAAIFTATACSSDGDGGGDNQAAADDFEVQLSEAFDNAPAIQDAIQRLALTLSGNPQDGVTLVPTATGYQGSVAADIDGNGSLETVANGTLDFINPSLGLAGGANLVIANITGGAPQTAHGTAVLEQTGPTSIEIFDGEFTTHTETRGNDLSLSRVDLEATSTGALVMVTGTSDFTFNGLDGLLTFEEDQTYGYRIRVSGSGFDTFTVP